MNSRALFLSLLFLAMALFETANAGNAKRVAVLDFRNSDNIVTNGEADYITEIVRTGARTALPRLEYVLMTKENILELLPPDRQALGECEGECEIETGRTIGAQYLVTGEIVGFGGEIRVTVRIYDVATGNLIESQTVKGKRALDLESPMEQLSIKLFASLPNANVRVQAEPIAPAATPPAATQTQLALAQLPDQIEKLQQQLAQMSDGKRSSPAPSPPAKPVNRERETYGSAGHGRWPFTSTRLVTARDLSGLSRSDLRLMRNEIYARHGRAFVSADLRAHFSRQPWYSVNPRFRSSDLTPLEMKNVLFIKKHE